MPLAAHPRVFRIVHDGATYTCREGESVLEALLRQGAETPFSCRAGSCHTCIRRATSGTVPDDANRTLRPELRERGYFLPCKCVPTTDLTVEPPLDVDLFTDAMVVGREELAPGVVRLLLEPATTIRHRPGQFVWVKLGDLTRSYSLADVPDEDPYLELHVKVVPGGALSPRLAALAVGDELRIQGPHGDVAYVQGEPTAPLLLVATGTGLAPLLGVLRDALTRGHTGPIRLFHGSRTRSGLYAEAQLRALESRHPNFRYVGCVSGDTPGEGHLRGRVHEVAFASGEDLRPARVYLAGHPRMVEEARRLALTANARPHKIHADPFDHRSEDGPAGTHDDRPTSHPASRAGASLLAPDPAMWKALGEGERMRTVLEDFYTRVYDDERLAPYFRGVTRQRLVEKVYSFMRGLFTGERIFFGDNPKNAHHWMVIDDDLFDYRNDLMEKVLRQHDLPEMVVHKWRAIEELFRGDIVKEHPWPLVRDGVVMPLEGYEELVLSIGSLCDGCGEEIATGTTVRCHVRLGTVYCPTCRAPAA